jgi:hypothetical protein
MLATEARSQFVVPSFGKEGSGVAKREEGAMRGAQRRGKRQIRFDLFLIILFVKGYDRILLYHPAPLLPGRGDYWLLTSLPYIF